MSIAPTTGEPVECILDAVGATPVVKLSRVNAPGAAELFAKLELFNPAGSTKDRIALAMIEAAERDGTLSPGATVIEPTSGNTGVGLALVCAAKGYRLVLTMPESMSLERRALLKSYGAELILTPAEESMDGAIRRAKELLEERPGAFMPQQFENPANPEAHRRTTAQEILACVDAEGGKLDAFVAGVGTGGTITGVGQVLRERFPKLLVVAVEPATSAVLSGRPAGPTKLQGLGAGFIPGILDTRIYDRIVTVDDRTAWEMKTRLAREEGILAGISSGAAVVAALAVAKELGAGKRVFTVLPDTGERYFSLETYFK